METKETRFEPYFIHSSINFLIYCSVGDRFKKVVFK